MKIQVERENKIRGKERNLSTECRIQILQHEDLHDQVLCHPAIHQMGSALTPHQSSTQHLKNNLIHSIIWIRPRTHVGMTILTGIFQPSLSATPTFGTKLAITANTTTAKSAIINTIRENDIMKANIVNEIVVHSMVTNAIIRNGTIIVNAIVMSSIDRSHRERSVVKAGIINPVLK